MLIGCAALGAGALALNLWVLFARLRKRTERKNRERDEWAKGIALKALREFLRAKLLAGGYGKHHAYYIAGDGRVLVADAVDFQFALFAGMEDFWHAVACAERQQRGAYLIAAPLEQINFGDGKCGYTRVHYCGGETYIDIAPVDNLAYPYRCSWATADEFKEAVVEAQAKAAERGCGDDCISSDFHGAIVSRGSSRKATMP